MDELFGNVDFSGVDDLGMASKQVHDNDVEATHVESLAAEHRL